MAKDALQEFRRLAGFDRGGLPVGPQQRTMDQHAVTEVKKCAVPDCDLPHCKGCGGHFAGGYSHEGGGDYHPGCDPHDYPSSYRKMPNQPGPKGKGR